MKIYCKIFIALILLGCLLYMPYGYYQFVRLATCVGFAWLAYTEYTEYAGKRLLSIVLCGAVAILFNPVIKMYLGREAWHIVDVVVAAALLIWVWFERKRTKSSK